MRYLILTGTVLLPLSPTSSYSQKDRAVTLCLASTLIIIIIIWLNPQFLNWTCHGQDLAVVVAVEWPPLERRKGYKTETQLLVNIGEDNYQILMPIKCWVLSFDGIPIIDTITLLRPNPPGLPLNQLSKYGKLHINMIIINEEDRKGSLRVSFVAPFRVSVILLIVTTTKSRIQVAAIALRFTFVLQQSPKRSHE